MGDPVHNREKGLVSASLNRSAESGRRAPAPRHEGSMCPASMCPLMAPEGSPWTGEKEAACPQRGAKLGGCGWWQGFGGKTCDARMAATEQVATAQGGRFVLQLGPVQADQTRRRPSKSFDCPKAETCQWQREAGDDLCPPRRALKLGLDPRICAY